MNDKDYFSQFTTDDLASMLLIQIGKMHSIVEIIQRRSDYEWIIVNILLILSALIYLVLNILFVKIVRWLNDYRRFRTNISINYWYRGYESL